MEDGRDTTPGVKYEIEKILHSRLEFKTVFVVPDKEYPEILKQLNAVSSHPSGEFLLMTPERVVEAIPLMLREAHKFWIPVKIA